MARKPLMPTGRASVARHTGTETLPRLLREAAVENLRQWAQKPDRATPRGG